MTIDTDLYHECHDDRGPPSWRECKRCHANDVYYGMEHEAWCSTPGIEAIRSGWGYVPAIG